MQVNIRNDKGSAWPVANPILTCASVIDASHPSTFVADPFLYIQVNSSRALFGWFKGKHNFFSDFLKCFICVQGSTLYVFFESKNALTKQGDIGVAQSSDGGASWKYLGVALDEEWHLSFPFVFTYNEEVFNSIFLIMYEQRKWINLLTF